MILLNESHPQKINPTTKRFSRVSTLSSSYHTAVEHYKPPPEYLVAKILAAVTCIACFVGMTWAVVISI